MEGARVMRSFIHKLYGKWLMFTMGIHAFLSSERESFRDVPARQAAASASGKVTGVITPRLIPRRQSSK
jgi:hypothetical protein